MLTGIFKVLLILLMVFSCCSSIAYPGSAMFPGIAKNQGSTNSYSHYMVFCGFFVVFFKNF